MKPSFKLSKVWEFVTFGFMAAILVVVWIQVLSRFFLSSIPKWTGEEAVSFLMIWMVMMGAAVSMGRNSHIVVDALVNVMPQKVRLWMNRLSYLVLTLFLGYFSMMGFLYVWGNRGTATPRLQIPTLLQQGSIPVGSLIMCGYSLSFLVKSFRRPGGHTPESDEEGAL